MSRKCPVCGILHCKDPERCMEALQDYLYRKTGIWMAGEDCREAVWEIWDEADRKKAGAE